MFSLLRFGPNRFFYRFSGQHFTPEQFRRTMGFCGLSFLVECCNAALVQLLFYRPAGLDILQRLANMMADSRFRAYVVLCTWAMPVVVCIGFAG